MSSRALLSSLALALAALAVLTGSQLIWGLVYTLALALAAAIAWVGISGRRLVLERSIPPARLTAGELFSETLTLRNRSLIPVVWCEVIDRGPLAEHHGDVVCSLGPHEAVAWSATGAFARRGRYLLGPTELRVGSPLGLASRRVLAQGQGEVVVHPPLHALLSLLPPWTGASVGNDREGRPLDMPPETSAVREYEDRDGLNRIHWLSTARTGRLMSRTYDSRHTADVLILLDLDAAVHTGAADESTLEYAVSIAASIASGVSSRGQAVGLVTSGAVPGMFAAARGEVQRLRLLDHLAEVRADGSTRFADVVAQHARRWRGRGGLVVITPSRDPAWVATLLDATPKSTRHLCVALEPVSFGADGAALRVLGAWRTRLAWWTVRSGDSLNPSEAAAV